MKKHIKRFIYQLVKYPLTAALTLQSIPVLRKASRTADKILLETPYHGQPILLIALYQPNALRPDIQRLLQLAKAAGLYIIGVNNATLSEPIKPHFDCYIERFNAGRDFGSYKTGFQYLFNKHIDPRCPRVIMMNDSVYYDTSRLHPFLQQLIHTHTEVLGAIDNNEIEYHLGSFCISISTSVLTHPTFHAFWTHYALSEIRQVVIHQGELELARCLKACVSSPAQYRALYDLSLLERVLVSDQTQMDMFLQLRRRSQYLAWPTLPSHPSIEQVLAYSSVRGQIHINAAFLLYLGLPLIKLDGFYRGVFSAEDVQLICQQLPESESEELKTLLFRRPYGKNTLFGWKKILFMWGYI